MASTKNFSSIDIPDTNPPTPQQTPSSMSLLLSFPTNAYIGPFKRIFQISQGKKICASLHTIIPLKRRRCSEPPMHPERAREGLDDEPTVALTAQETARRFIQTGYVSIHDQSIIVKEPREEPLRKIRKCNKGDAWRLWSPRDYKANPRFKYGVFRNEGTSQERIEYTEKQRKNKSTALSALAQGLLVAKQRPLLNTVKAKSTTFNVIDPSGDPVGGARYKLLRHPSLASRMRPRGLSRLGTSLDQVVRRMPPAAVSELKLQLWSDPDISLDEATRITNSQNVLNSVASVESHCTPADVVTEYATDERLDSTASSTHTPIRRQLAQLPLRESVLIAQEMRWTCPIKHGEKAVMKLYSEFFPNVPQIGYLSARHWSSDREKRSKKWRACQKKELE
ncbi:uncharacterized protein PV09_07045 [Verruconis gallopava]|uniref:Uncharacterized protein n=1 Tax=Verruconis gallopava TaxID=253628 RepID=A0A0D1XH81_9PEZI|nr:uncharacterized protein PV09_07045 [Verruconis gallopava]KIW01571.1 hypothetical protein PV09_07045 [Verruconis gallopava]